MSQALATYLQDRTTDAVLFFAGRILEDASDPHSRQEAMEQVITLLSNIKKDILRESYVDEIARKHRWVRKSDLKKMLGTLQEDAAQREKKVEEEGFSLDLPEQERNDVMRYGFYAKKDGFDTGYYFRFGEEGHFKAVTNFILEPLFHKYDQADNTRIIKIDNGVKPPEIVEMPSKALISVDQFKSFLFDKGPFFFEGTKAHLDKLNKRYLFEFPKAYELKSLGWQNEGFFAFYNMSYNGKLTEYNDAGLVQHGDHNFFSPASSEIYKDFRQDDDDQYENDRYLEYRETSIRFSEWAALMNKAYDDHAKSGVIWTLVCLFKDLVFKVDNNAPFLYSYGPSQSGKSKFHESISNLFFNQMPAFNLNAGTDFAFFQRMSRFKNCPILFNEFNDHVVKDEWFEAIKGAYDGEGRERGKGLSKQKTETQKVNGLIMLAGQYLSTRDDNSVLSRSILRSFRKVDERPAEQTKAYDRLKQLEKEGISSILTELLSYRDRVKEQYAKGFSQNLERLAAQIRSKGEQFNERVLRNYCSLLTMYKLFKQYIKLPWQEEEYEAWVLEQIQEMSDMIAQTDVLVDFWNTLEVLFENGVLKEGGYFKIEQEQQVKYHHKGKEQRTKSFSEPRDILYLRLGLIHQEYSKWKRSVGQSAMDLSSLKTYLKQRDNYYIGYSDGTRFERFRKTQDGEMRRKAFPTSAHMFDYAEIGLNLKHHDANIEDNSIEGIAERKAAIEKRKAQESLSVEGEASSETDEDDLPF